MGNSTESQPSSSAQGFWETIPKMVESLLKALKDIQPWAQFGAFFLVVALVATIIATLSMNDDNIKFKLILAFFLIFCLFVLFLYALNGRENKLENYKTNLGRVEKELKLETDRLQIESDKRIKQLKFIHVRLKDIATELREVPSSTAVESLQNQTLSLLNNIEDNLEDVDDYRRDLASARAIEARTKDVSIYERIAEESSAKSGN